jgi:hypothetical protein
VKYTKIENARRQRVWQLKRKLKRLLAWRWFLSQLGSKKGTRGIKTALRKATRHKDSSPRDLIRASELLLWIELLETGKSSIVRAIELKLEPPQPMSPTPTLLEGPTQEDDADPELRELLEKSKRDK